jgi:hypothetical protein
MKRRLGDRRGRPRFEIVGELWGTLETVIAMPLRNIGRGGALVQSAVALAPQSVHHVAVSCGGTQTPASVRVQHVRTMVGSDGRDYYLIGLEFLSTPAELLAQIESWTLGGGAPPMGAA